MTSSMCTGVFVWAGGKPPWCAHCSAVLFLTDLLSVSVFLCLCRLTWSRRGRCTWSSICPGLPLRVKPPQHTQHTHAYTVSGGEAWEFLHSEKFSDHTCKADVNESGKVELFKDNKLRGSSFYQRIGCWYHERHHGVKLLHLGFQFTTEIHHSTHKQKVFTYSWTRWFHLFLITFDFF